MGVWNPGPGGTNGNDTFVGDGTNEVIQGLGGEDNLQGNGGDDTFVISAASHISAGDFYYGGDGADLMRLTAAGTYNFSPETTILSVETLRLEANLTANFSALNWDSDWGIINGWTIDGNGRTATFNFYDLGGVNSLAISNWNFTNGNFTVNMYASSEGSSLYGSNVADVINGGIGNDFLSGGAGNDRLVGGAGNDTYYFNAFFNDALNDTVVELSNGGVDTIETQSSVSLANFANVENLESATNSGITLEGNGLDNTIIGGSFANDTLIGGGGNDRLQGRSGIDTLIGGTGNDTYVFVQEGAIDTIVENANEGTDLIVVSAMNTATITSFSMANYANVENLEYDSTSTSGTRTITGNSLNNVITAMGSVATNDTIDGGAGNDTMNGGGGTDTYIVDSLGDVVIETAAGTIDTIRTALASYALSNAVNSLVENLTFTGTGAFSGRGNNLANVITGGAGDDTLEGGGGADTLSGGAGTGDIASYANAAAGLTLDLANLALNTGDAAGDSYSGIEAYFGSGHADDLRGGALADILSGGGGNDTIDGRGGADRLNGGAGDDALVGGAGMDTAIFNIASTSSTWTRNFDGSLTVTAGADGVDTLTGVEILQFTDRSVYLDQPSHTFFGDYASDILLRRLSDGVTAIWNMNGATVTQSDVTQWQAGTEWSLQGFGDFNLDGRDDFLLRRNSDGVTAVWSMNGTSVIASDVTTWQAGLDWSIQGVADFDGDGFDDILWRRDDGVTAIWQMNGTAVAQADVTEWQAGNEWIISGLGDFNGDGRDDFLLRRDSDGVMSIWQMNGASVEAADVTTQQAGLEWSVSGVGDFNGDGRDDLLLRNGDGVSAIWTMDGVSVTSANLTSQQVSSDWSFAAVGDYDGDGRDDILLRHDSGLTVIWRMDGATVLSADETSQQAGAEWDYI